jgi:molecular chaperone Hsp33
MQNKIIKTLIFNKQIRLFLVNNTELITNIIQMNESSNKVTKACLANSVSIASLLSATLKGTQRLSTTIILSSPKSKIHTEADANGNIRGFANNFLLSHEQNKYSTVRELIGKRGSIRMIKGVDMNQFTGITDMPFQDIDKDFSHYFKQSDQTDTLFKTNMEWKENNTIKNSCGLYAQVLPSGPNHLLEIVEEKFDKLLPILRNLHQYGEKKIDTLLNQHFAEAEIIGYSNTQFHCGCSKELFYGLLHSLEKSELEEYVLTGTPIISTCNSCDRNYIFSTEEIKPFIQEGTI